MDKTPEQTPDFEFHLITYANEWELGNWGDDKGKKLVEKSYSAGYKQCEKDNTALREQLQEREKDVDLLREAFNEIMELSTRRNNDDEIHLIARASVARIDAAALAKTEPSQNSAHSFTGGSDL